MKYFKVQKGYNLDDYISIKEHEVPKALRAEITGKVAIFEEGSVSGNHIIAVVPDWHKEMGWNRSHQLDSEDYREIGDKRRRDYSEFYELASTNTQRELQGLPPLEKLERLESSEGKEVSKEVKQLAQKFKV